MHVHCLHWLMSTGLLVQSDFSNHVNPRLVKWCQWRAPILQWGPDIASTVSTHLSRPCSGKLTLYGCMWTIDKLYHCVILLLCFSLCHHPTHPRTPPTHPLIYTDPILMNSMKNKKLMKIRHYLLTRLVVQMLMDN